MGKRKREEGKRKSNNSKKLKKNKTPDKDEGVMWFDLKEAKKEVRKFGITGMVGEDKKMATLNLLMELGAKPPKNKYVNYKLFQENKKKEKAERAEEGKKQPKKMKKKCRNFNDVKGTVDGQIGTFKDGLLKLNRTDLKMLTKQKKSSKDFEF